MIATVLTFVPSAHVCIEFIYRYTTNDDMRHLEVYVSLLVHLE
jgi:hypothetical protein